MRWRVPLAVLGLCLLSVAGSVLAATDIRGVRLWRAPDNTRLVFDLSGPVKHSVFTLAAPERIVIDVSGAQLQMALEQLNLSNTPIRAVRAAQRAPGELRMVLDLSARVTPKSFTLEPNQQYGHRLVVDLFDGEAPSNLPPVQPSLPVTPTQAPARLPPPPGGKRDIIIAIDAGHGGEDPGPSARTKNSMRSM